MAAEHVVDAGKPGYVSCAQEAALERSYGKRVVHALVRPQAKRVEQALEIALESPEATRVEQTLEIALHLEKPVHGVTHVHPSHVSMV
jgi:hypothetical protein